MEGCRLTDIEKLAERLEQLESSPIGCNSSFVATSPFQKRGEIRVVTAELEDEEDQEEELDSDNYLEDDMLNDDESTSSLAA